MYTVYTIDNCPYCTRAKALLTDRGASYEEIQVDRNNSEQVQALVAKSKMRTFPQIFRDGALVGGFTELEQLDRKSGL